MRLLYITNGIHGAAGLERVLSIKASYLADKLGYDIHILTLNSGNETLFYDFSPKIKLHDIVVKGNPLQYIKQYVQGVRSVIKQLNPDVISVCDDGLKGFFVPSINPFSTAIIYERHVSKVIEMGDVPTFLKRIKVELKFSLMNFLAKKFDRFVVLTKDNVKEWNLNNIIVISNPLSFYPSTLSNTSCKKVIAVGRQSFQKGFDLLLKSWQIVHQIYPDWELEIYGKTNESLALKKEAEKLGIAANVQFYDPVKNIQEKYLSASIYAFSSRFEGFGMVLIEAMACGVPCVSFDCPCGPRDIIADGTDGFLVENGNVDEFAKKLLVLIENAAKRKEMGTIAHENVKRYLPENIVQQWDVLFNKLIS